MKVDRGREKNSPGVSPSFGRNAAPLRPVYRETKNPDPAAHPQISRMQLPRSGATTDILHFSDSRAQRITQRGDRDLIAGPDIAEAGPWGGTMIARQVPAGRPGGGRGRLLSGLAQ
jgi:hypothetical protein